MKKIKQQRGITLVALVITIIILVILAGIAIASLTNTGLFGRAQEAKKVTENAQKQEKATLNDYSAAINEAIGGTPESTADPSLPTNPATTITEAQSDYMLTKTVNSPMVDAYGNKITFDSNGNPTAKNDDAISEYGGTYQELATSTKGNTTAKDINDFKTKASAAESGGFYIGRFEARKNSSGATTEKGTDSVWNNITQPNAATQARNMYQNATTFTSDLVNSYAWDTATLFLQTFGDNKKYSKKTPVSSSYASTGTNNTSTKDVQCNVYDMASNVIECNTETVTSYNGITMRGVGYLNYSSYTYEDRYCAVYRNYRDNTFICSDLGFRIILYL